MSLAADALRYFLNLGCPNGGSWEIALVRNATGSECTYSGYARQAVTWQNTLAPTSLLISNANEIEFPVAPVNQGSVLGIIVPAGTAFPVTVATEISAFGANLTAGKAVHLDIGTIFPGDNCPSPLPTPPSTPFGTGADYTMLDFLGYRFGFTWDTGPLAAPGAVETPIEADQFGDTVTEPTTWEIYSDISGQAKARNTSAHTYSTVDPTLQAVALYDGHYDGSSALFPGGLKLIGIAETFVEYGILITTGDTIAAGALDIHAHGAAA